MDRRTRLDREYYESEARLAAGLSDAERVEILRDLLLTCCIFRKSKDTATLRAESRVELELDEPRFPPGYLELARKGISA
jgi:putative ubiquitin-RnfH superfamily antitoxin RatB of RatAB toxin-antitoxin module